MALPLPSLALPYQPGHSKTKHKSTVHCTHRRVTRLYSEYDWQRCTVCQRVPDFGYLYHCTQETDGNLQVCDFIYKGITMELGNLRVDNQEPASCSASNSSSHTCHIETNPISRDDAMDTETAIDENLARVYDGKRKFETAFPPDPAHISTNCNLQICHTCRPTYKDRAWQSLDYVVNNQPTIPSEYEFCNRRISNATTIANIDYHPTDMHNNVKKDNYRQCCTVRNGGHLDAVPCFSRHQRGNLHASPNSLTLSKLNGSSHRIQHEDNASDADDEKEFGDGEDSETSNTDVDINSAEHSETNDFLPVFHSQIPLPHSAVRTPL